MRHVARRTLGISATLLSATCILMYMAIALPAGLLLLNLIRILQNLSAKSGLAKNFKRFVIIYRTMTSLISVMCVLKIYKAAIILLYWRVPMILILLANIQA